LVEKGENKELLARILELQKSRDYQGLQKLVQDSRPLMEKEFGPFTDYSYSEEELKIYETLGGAPHLDGEYTVFGKVISGLNVLDSIANVQVDRRDRPEEDVFMRIRVKTLKRKKITKIYGYQYPQN
jgi:peptidyl-prolyl cis-trans isomerase B (cyclophilin B)